MCHKPSVHAHVMWLILDTCGVKHSASLSSSHDTSPRGLWHLFVSIVSCFETLARSFAHLLPTNEERSFLTN